MLSRLVRGCIAMAFTSLLVCVQLHRLADIVKGGEAAQLHDTSNGTRANRVLLATDTGVDVPGRRCADAISSGTRLHRYGLHC